MHMFLGLPDTDPLVRVIDPDPSIILLSSSERSKKNLDSYYFMTSFGLLFLKNNVNLPSKIFNSLFVGVLKVNDENSRILIPIH
jgi:hypothetical protein